MRDNHLLLGPFLFSEPCHGSSSSGFIGELAILSSGGVPKSISIFVSFKSQDRDPSLVCAAQALSRLKSRLDEFFSYHNSSFRQLRFHGGHPMNDSDELKVVEGCLLGRISIDVGDCLIMVNRYGFFGQDGD